MVIEQTWGELRHLHFRPLFVNFYIVSTPPGTGYLKGHFTLWKKNPYTEGLLCLLLHSEGTAIFYVD